MAGVTNMSEISQLLKELCSYPTESEWFEFKENWYEKDLLGQYISALSNSAAIEGKKVVVLTIPAGQTLEGFFAGESVPVNQKLSEIFLQLHISEKTGRGVPKVVEKYGKDAYEFHENTILVTIPFRWINSVGWNVEQIGNNNVIPESSPKSSSKNEENFVKFDESTNKFDVNTESSMKSSMKIIELMRLNSMITAVELAEILKISKRAVDKQIQKLRESNKIRRIGPDKGGHWEIIEKSEDGK